MAENPYLQYGILSADGTPTAIPPAPESAAPAPAPETPPAPGTISAIIHGIPEGLISAGQGFINTAMDVTAPATTAIAKAAGIEGTTAAASADIRRKVGLGQIQESDTTAGKITREVVRLGLGIGLTSAVAPAIPGVAALGAAGKAGQLAVMGLDGAVGNFTVASKGQENLAHFIREVPQLQNPILDYMAGDPGDSELTSRLKSALEGAIIGPLVGSTFKLLKSFRAAKVLEEAGKPEEAASLLSEAQAASAKAVAKVAKGQVDTSIGVPGSEGVDVYHGTPAAYEKLAPEPTWVAENPKTANFYTVSKATSGDVVEPAANVRPYKLDPHANLAPEEKFTTNMTQEENIAALKAEGYDGVRFDGGVTGKGPHYLIFDPAESLVEKFTGERGAVPAISGSSAVGAPGAAEQATFRMTPEDRATFKAGLQMHGVGGGRNVTGSNQGPNQLNLGLRDGVLNYDKIRSSEDVKSVISDMVSVARESLPNMEGTHFTLDQINDLALWMGKSPTDLYSGLATMAQSVGAKGDASQEMAAALVAGKTLIKTVSDKIAMVAQRIDTLEGTTADKIAFVHLTDILATTLDHVSGIQTAAARATAAGRIRITGQITNANLADLLEKVGGGDGVSALAQRIRMAGPNNPAGIIGAIKGTPTFMDKLTAIHNYIWMSGVLGGLKTSLTNITTTAINSGIWPGLRMMGGLAQGLTGRGFDQFAEGYYQYAYMRQVFSDSLSWAGKAWMANGSLLDAASNPLQQVTREIPLSAKFLAEGINRPDAGLANQALGNAALGFDKALESVFGIKEGLSYLGSIVGWSGRALTTQDEFFKQLTYRSHVLATAAREGIQNGMAGDVLKQFVDGKLASSLGVLGQALDKPALTAAKNATFTQDLAVASFYSNRTLSEIASTAAQSHPWIKGVLAPFVKVPANLMREAWDFTPGLNLARAEFLRQLQAGGEEQAMALGKLGIGTLLWGSAAALAYEGRITGGGPKDKDLLRQMGPDWKPYSIQVGTNADGTRNYISYARLDPFGAFFGISADMAEMSAHMDEGQKAEMAMRASMAMFKNISSKTYLRGLTDFLDVVQGDDEAKMTKYIQSRIASYVPGVFQLANTDDEIKNLRGWFDGAKSRIPGLSGTVEAKRDNFGEKIMPPMGWPYTAVNPYTFFQTTNDPVRKELAALAQSDSQAKFSLPPATFGPKDHQVDLREIKNPTTGQSAYDRWLELHSKYESGGQTLHEAQAETIASSSYKQLRDEMGKGSTLHQQNLPSDLLRKNFNLYEKLTFQQMADEFAAMGKDIPGAKLQYKIGGKLTRGLGTGAETKGINQLRAIAGQE